MKIIVCVKQVPDTSDIKWTENNTLVREGLESILNPYDEYAIEAALQIKELYKDVEITALTMGPPQAIEVLKRAIAMGVDSGVLLSDRKFAGADTVATSTTLAAAIKNQLGEFDLIICGQYAVDGDTAQTGPSIAENLDIPQVTYVKNIKNIDNSSLTIEALHEEDIQLLKVDLPALICVGKIDTTPRQPRIAGFMKAKDTDIKTIGLDDIGLTPDDVGIKGSPTFVSKAFRATQKQAGEILDEGDLEKNVKLLVSKLKELNIIGGNND